MKRLLTLLALTLAVSGIAAQSLQLNSKDYLERRGVNVMVYGDVAYGNNRSDFTFIAGGVVPGMLLLQPDYIENKDDWPFFWGQNECTIGQNAMYLYYGNILSGM